MNIRELAELLNNKSSNYHIGTLQYLRTKIKGLSKRPTWKIFTEASISEAGWAFHFGGRSEIQFNIGFEDDGLRYGLAFSLEPSQSLPDVSVLYPKILRFNILVREKPELFAGYRMWYWYGNRSDFMKVSEIPSDWIRLQCFIFFGKMMNSDNINTDEILSTFDSMLPIYLEVESNQAEPLGEKKAAPMFKFKKSHKTLISGRSYTTIEKEISIDIRHTLIQEKLIRKLTKEYGEDNVSPENEFDGNRIDVVLREGKKFTFFEIKTGYSVRSCIRQAIGQLLDYAFWPGMENAHRIVVVGEPECNDEDNNYINYLKAEFRIPIEYMSIKI